MQIYFSPLGVLFGNVFGLNEKGWEGCVGCAGEWIDRDFIPPALRLGK